jgi:hypothetical protein
MTSPALIQQLHLNGVSIGGAERRINLLLQPNLITIPPGASQ